MTVVIDASVVVAALVDTGTDGTWAESVLAESGLVAPHHLPVEVANILRRASLADDISDDVAEKLRRRLSTAERDRLTRPETTNPQAYELALQGRFFTRQSGTQNRKRGIEYYQRAIALDPNYALPYVGLANNYQNLVVNSVLDPKEYMPKVEAA